MWKLFIDDVVFSWTDSEENLARFLKELNAFQTNIKFTFEKSRMKVNFLDGVKNGRFSTDLYSKQVESHQRLYTIFVMLNRYKNSFTFKLCGKKELAQRERVSSSM